MRTEFVDITPKLALKYLEQNTDNRPVRPTHLDTLRQSFMRGEYVATHQGIAFDKNGVLLDGQHRLIAISEMPEGFSCLMMVTWGLDRAAVYPVVDTVQAKRNTADVLHVSRGHGEVGNFLARIYTGRMGGLTPTFVEPFVEFIAPELSDLLGFCNTTRRTWASAPVRAAAVISMKTGDSDFVKLVYRALVLNDFESMPRSAKAVFRAHLVGSVRAADAYDIYARGLKIFDQDNAQLTKIQINDISEVIKWTRELLDAGIFKSAKKYPVTRDTKPANQKKPLPASLQW